MAKSENKTKSPKSVQISLPERIDTFNQDQILTEIKEAMNEVSAEAVLDLTETRFVSLLFIKKLERLAFDYRANSKEVVLLNGTEKIKKQIDIFSKLEFFTVRRAVSKPEWPGLDASADF